MAAAWGMDRDDQNRSQRLGESLCAKKKKKKGKGGEEQTKNKITSKFAMDREVADKKVS